MEKKKNSPGTEPSARDKEINRLVDAVKNKDTEAFVELLGFFSRTISALACTFSLPSSEHEDLCQEARMALYRAAMSYDGVSAKFSTYAASCMTNAMITFASKYKTEGAESVDGFDVEKNADSASDAFITELEYQELLGESGSFAGLSDYERRVLNLKLSGYKVSEIARMLSKSTKSVENTLFRARSKIKAYING